MDNRGIILEALLLYEKGEDFADRILKGVLDKYSYLHKYERSFISRVYTGTIERKLTLDYIINIFSTVKINKQKPVIRNILRMSVYQIVFMDSIPIAAAIDEAVKLAKKKKFASLSGFVNGVLRNAAKNKDCIAYPKESDSNCMSVKYSCPEWICEHFIKELGRDKAEEILENSLKIRPLIIRANLSKISRDELMGKLVSEGVKADFIGDSDKNKYVVQADKNKADNSEADNKDDSLNGLYTDAALILNEYDVLTELDSFKEGLFTVQDLSSQQVIGGTDFGFLKDYLNTTEHCSNKDTEEDETFQPLIIDVCAAPGGKTCHIADFLEKEGINARIISRDLSEDKIRKIDENTRRCNFKSIKTEVYDALRLDESLTGKADVVIADLPCSGLGVIGRKVDIKYRLKQEDLNELADLQRDILSVVAQYVKPGGMVIYSTCTVNKSENEDNAKWIEKTLPFKLCQPYTRLLNDNMLTDGFFIARFVMDKEIINKCDDLRSLYLTELEDIVTGLGDKKYRAKQIFEWMHKHQASDFSDMGNIPKKLINAISESYSIYKAEICKTLISKDGTRKYLFKLYDGEYIESVYMQYEHGNSVCVSSQAGCRMGCKFCASTVNGLSRNLTAGEMLMQIYEIMKDTGTRISNVVIMGSGEPFDNYENVIRFMRLLSDENGLNISGRNITVSTCGLKDKILEFADEGLTATLAISLHAPNDKKRREIMPVANKYSIDEVISACRAYYEKTKRRLTFEYSLISGVNDSDEDAAELAGLLKGLNCHVNLIRVNPVDESGYLRPANERANSFKDILEKNHINATIRRSLGGDINGACGQLRSSYQKENNITESKYKDL